MSLSYAVPKKIVQKAQIESCSVYTSGTNLFDFYNPFSYKSASGTYNTFPALRTVSLGVNVVF